MCSKPACEAREYSIATTHYKQVKEVFSALPNKITCVSIDFTAWSYRDLQLLAKANNIRANQKKQTLIQLLQGI